MLLLVLAYQLWGHGVRILILPLSNYSEEIESPFVSFVANRLHTQVGVILGSRRDSKLQGQGFQSRCLMRLFAGLFHFSSIILRNRGSLVSEATSKPKNSCMTSLDLTKLVKLLIIQHKQGSLIQTK